MVPKARLSTHEYIIYSLSTISSLIVNMSQRGIWTRVGRITIFPHNCLSYTQLIVLWRFSGELLVNCSKLALVPRALSYLADVFLFWVISLLFLPGVGRFSLCISAWLCVFILQHHYAVYGRFLGMLSTYLVLLMLSKWLVSTLQPLEGFLSCRCHKHDLEYLFASLFVKYCDVG